MAGHPPESGSSEPDNAGSSGALASRGGKAAMPTISQDAWRPPVTNVVNLVLAEQYVLVAEGLRMLLAAEDDLDVLGLAHHSGQAIELAATHQPTVLVLDAELPVGDLDETLAAVRAAASATRLLVLSGAAHPATTVAVLAAGADGWLAKDCSSRQVATAIRQLAAAGQAPVAAATPTGRDPSVELRVRTLTAREREILGLLTHGLTTRRIAQELCLSYQTVRSHIYNLSVKLGVHSQLEAVRFALDHAVVEAPGPLARERRSA
jgi:DNA-binding NarL/FixJ family response regulator